MGNVSTELGRTRRFGLPSFSVSCQTLRSVASEVGSERDHDLIGLILAQALHHRDETPHLLR